MRHIFTLLLLCFYVQISAQINMNYVDEFTGDHIVSTDGVVLKKNLGSSFTLNLKHQQGEDFIGCTLYWNLNCYSIQGGKSLLYIKFTDGSIRKAVCCSDAIAGYSMLGSVTIWGTSMLYIPEEKEFIKDLTEKLIQKFRYETSLGYYEGEVKPKKAKQFRGQAQAFYNIIKK